mgnify:CR=1 FL=1
MKPKQIYVLYIGGQPVDFRFGEEPGYKRKQLNEELIEYLCDKVYPENLISLGWCETEEEVKEKTKKEYGQEIPVEWTGPDYYVIWGAADPDAAGAIEWSFPLDVEFDYYFEEYIEDYFKYEDASEYVKTLYDLGLIDDNDYHYLGNLENFDGDFDYFENELYAKIKEKIPVYLDFGYNKRLREIIKKNSEMEGW